MFRDLANDRNWALSARLLFLWRADLPISIIADIVTRRRNPPPRSLRKREHARCVSGQGRDLYPNPTPKPAGLAANRRVEVVCLQLRMSIIDALRGRQAFNARSRFGLTISFLILRLQVSAFDLARLLADIIE